MRKIVDTNFLQAPEFREYLAKSSSNYAIFFDCTAIEALKKEPLVTLLKSMKIVSEFPKQVIVLKPIPVLCSLRGRAAGLQRRMIDNDQTRSFPEYCRMLALAEQGNKPAIQHLLQLSQVAQSIVQQSLVEALDMPERLKRASEEFSLDELGLIRRQMPYGSDLIRKMTRMIAALSYEIFTTHSRVRGMPPQGELLNTYIYRTAITVFALMIQWIERGKQVHMKPETMQNDLVDLHFIVVASFFDGLLSKDQKLLKTYELSQAILFFLFKAFERSVAQR